MKERNPKVYTVEELVADERFQNYCLKDNVEDIKFWEDIIFSNWDQKSTFEQAYNIVKSLSDERVFDLSTLEAKVVQLSSREKKQSNIKRKMLAFAAVFVIGITIWNLQLHEISNPIMITQATSFGETKCIVLPDGSTAHLNSHSSLTYPASMDDVREVSFAGEVYFDVETTPNKRHFSVSGTYGEVEVTGTEFNLKYRKGIFEATLVEGTIIYRKDQVKDIKMSPSEHLIYENNTIQISQVETSQIKDWMAGRMIFKDEKLKEIIISINQDYGLEVMVENEELKEKKISANMLTSDPIVLLKSIGIIYDFEVEEKNNIIILK